MTKQSRKSAIREDSGLLRRLRLLAMTGCLCFFAMTVMLSAPAQAQLVGTDTAPGTACSVEDAVRMTAHPTGTGGYILTCESGVWVATLNAALPTANEQVATKQYVDSAVAAGGIGACVDDDATLCALETSRSSDDPDFTAANIKSGVNILGVTGTFTGGLSGPAGCANIGDLCADGTVFAGYHPITHAHLFIPTTDQGTTSVWTTSSGTDDIATDYASDGAANSAQVANSTTFPAFKLCKDLGTGGHADWYLPSQVELYYLWSIRGTIEARGNTNFQNAAYWSSTEYYDDFAWAESFISGGQGYNHKSTTSVVRCVRQ